MEWNGPDRVRSAIGTVRNRKVTEMGTVNNGHGKRLQRKRSGTRRHMNENGKDLVKKRSGKGTVAGT